MLLNDDTFDHSTFDLEKIKSFRNLDRAKKRRLEMLEDEKQKKLYQEELETKRVLKMQARDIEDRLKKIRWNETTRCFHQTSEYCPDIHTKKNAIQWTYGYNTHAKHTHYVLGLV